MALHPEFPTRVKLAVYRSFAATGQRPDLEQVSATVGSSESEVRLAYRQLAEERLLVLEPDGRSIRMAPPFSGIPTQHAVDSEGIRYYANCAWDALGVPAALRRPGTITSRCEQSGEPLILEVEDDWPPVSDWLFHCPLPASEWWSDIVFT